MTDKQMIIDGVDVKDCKRRIGKDNYCRYYKRLCSENNYNCIWKKYYRKEQECEELKGRLKYIINENKVLKDCATDEDIDIVALKNYISTLEFSNDQLKDVIKKYEECNKFLVEENGKTYTRLEYKLLRILTEIKEIAEECYYKCNSMNNCNISCKYYNNCNGEFSYLLACLNKQISECEANNDR